MSRQVADLFRRKFRRNADDVVERKTALVLAHCAAASRPPAGRAVDAPSIHGADLARTRSYLVIEEEGHAATAAPPGGHALGVEVE